VNQLENDLAKAFRERLSLLFPQRLESLTVFGSRARGEARRDSDMDVLVLLKGEVERAVKHQVYDLAYDMNAENDFAIPLAPLVMSVEAFSELKNRERALAREILRDGIHL